MKVQRIVLPDTNQVRWLVIDDTFLPIKPIQQYLAFLESCSKSPLTLRTYAHHLKVYWDYLTQLDIAWYKANIDTVSNFILFLKENQFPENIISIEEKISIRSERTINQMITAVTSFYDYHHRKSHLAELPLHVSKKSFGNNNGYKSFLHHITKSKPIKSNLIKLKEKKSVIKTVDAKTVKAMLDCCKYKRDKFLIALLYETGCRIGQALGLRHEDIESYNNVIRIMPRENNVNHARAKTRDINVIHVRKELMSLYFEYFMEEYGEHDSPYVFINLWNGAIGQPIAYNSVIALFKNISKKLNRAITPHILRHTHATELLKDGWNAAHIQKRLGHRNIQTTMNIYTHLTDEDTKKYFQEYNEKRKTK